MAVERDQFVVQVVVDSKGAVKGFKDVNGQLTTLSRNVKKTNDETSKLGKALQVLGFSVTALNQGLELATKALGGLQRAFTLTGGAAIRAEKELAEVFTLVTDGSKTIADLTAETRFLRGEFGSDRTELIKGFYQALSSGAIDATQSLGFMNDALKLQTAGVTTTSLAVEAITNSLIAFGDEIETTKQVTDAFIIAMQKNKTTVGELAKEFPRVGVVAKNLGTSFEETISVLATLASGAGNTAEAVTRFQSVLVSFGKGKALEVFQNLPEDVNSAEKAIGKLGLVGALELLVEQVGITAEGLNKLFEDQGAKTAVAQLLTGQLADKFKETFDAISEASATPGEATEQAFQKMAVITSFRLGSLEQRSKISFERIGDVIKGFAVDILDPLVAALEKVSDVFVVIANNRTVIDGLAKSFMSLASAAGLFAAVRIAGVVSNFVLLQGGIAKLLPVIAAGAKSFALFAATLVKNTVLFAGLVFAFENFERLIKGTTLFIQTLAVKGFGLLAEAIAEVQKLLLDLKKDINDIAKASAFFIGNKVEIFDLENSLEDLKKTEESLISNRLKLAELAKEAEDLDKEGFRFSFIDDFKDIFKIVDQGFKKVEVGAGAAGSAVDEMADKITGAFVDSLGQQEALLLLQIESAGLAGENVDLIRLQAELAKVQLDIKLKELSASKLINDEIRAQVDLLKQLIDEDLESRLPITLGSVIDDFRSAIESVSEIEVGSKTVGKTIKDAFKAGADFIEDSIGSAARLLSFDGPGQTTESPGFDLLNQIPDVVKEAFRVVLEADLVAAAGAIGNAASKLGSVISGVAQILDPESINAISESLRKFIQDFPRAFSEAIQGLDSVLTEFIDKLPSVLTQILNMLPGIIDQLASKLPAIIDVLIDGMIMILDRLPQIVDSLIEKLPEIITQILDRTPEVIQKILEVLPVIVAQIIQIIPRIIADIADRLPAIIEELVAGIVGASGEIVGALVDTLILKGGIVKIIEAVIKLIPRVALALIKGLARGLQRLMQGIMNGITFQVPASLEEFPAQIEAALSSLAEQATGISEQIFGVLDDQTQTAEDQAARLQSAIVSGFDIGIDDFNLATDGLNTIFDDFLEVMLNVIFPGFSIFVAAIEAAGPILEKWAEEIGKLWEGFREAVLEPLINALTEVWRAVFAFFTDELGGLITAAWEGVIGFLKDLGPFIEGAFEAVFNLFKGLGTIVEEAFAAVIGLFSGLGDIVSEAFSGVLTLFNGLGDIVSDAFGFLGDIFTDLGEGLTTAFSSLTNFTDIDLADEVSNAFDGVIRFFSGGPGSFADKLGIAFTNPIRSLEKAFDFELPDLSDLLDFKWPEIKIPDFSFPEITLPDTSGLETGFNNAINGLNTAAGNLKANIKAGGTAAFDAIKDVGNNIVQGIRKGIEDIGGAFADFFGFNEGGLVPGFAVGGAVQAFQGGGGVDSVPALLTPGEFVLSRNSVESIGADTAAFINETGTVPGSNVTLNIQPGAIVIEARTDVEGASDIAEEVLELIRRRTVDGEGVVFEEGLRA